MTSRSHLFLLQARAKSVAEAARPVALPDVSRLDKPVQAQMRSGTRR
jgi:hypothetical protein